MLVKVSCHDSFIWRATTSIEFSETPKSTRCLLWLIDSIICWWHDDTLLSLWIPSLRHNKSGVLSLFSWNIDRLNDYLRVLSSVVWLIWSRTKEKMILCCILVLVWFLSTLTFYKQAKLSQILVTDSRSWSLSILVYVYIKVYCVFSELMKKLLIINIYIRLQIDCKVWIITDRDRMEKRCHVQKYSHIFLMDLMNQQSAQLRTEADCSLQTALDWLIDQRKSPCMLTIYTHIYNAHTNWF